MKSTGLLSYLSSNLAINESEIDSIVKKCEFRKYYKAQFILRKNEFCRHTFFVERGLLRQFSIDSKGKEHVVAFAPENWFMTDRESSYFNQPSTFYIQAIEDSEVVLIDEAFVQSLAGKIPSFNDFNNRLLHNHIRHMQSRINMLLSVRAEARYLKFIEMYPDILLRVPQAMIASYLGITPESLSRVRKELAKRNFKD